MHTYLRNKPVWLQLVIFGFLTIGILLVITFIGVKIVAVSNHLSVFQVASMTQEDFARPELSGVLKGMMVLQILGLFLLPPLVFSYLADPDPGAYLGLRRPQRISFIFIAVVTTIAAYFTVEFFAMINEYIVHLLPKSTQNWIMSGESNANGMLENILSMKNKSDLLVSIFLVGALPAIGEELFFRGILQKFFIQFFKKAWPGIIFTGFFFSAFHMQFMGFLPRMALGVILGALYWYSGSIYASMLGHFLFNTISIFLIYFKIAEPDSKTSATMPLVLIGIASILLILFLLNYLRKRSTTRYATEFPPVKEVTIFDDPEQPL